MITSVLLLMQFVVTAKAGFVNYVDGIANVHRQQQVQVGTPIETKVASHVELLLSPGSFLRVGENSKVVFDSVQLSNIDIRVLAGNAIVETASVNKDFPIHVTSGNRKMTILAAGLYHFSEDSAAVLSGKLRNEASGETLKKGQELASMGGTDRVEKLEASADDLDDWSQQRSGDVAKANVLAYRDRSPVFYNSYADYSTYGVFPLDAAWLYSPFLGGFTFLPFQSYRSFYGYNFTPITGFGFTPFLPAANRPFTSQTASAATARPVGGVTRGPNTYTNWGGSNGHLPIHATGNAPGNMSRPTPNGGSAPAAEMARPIGGMNDGGMSRPSGGMSSAPAISSG